MKGAITKQASLSAPGNVTLPMNTHGRSSSRCSGGCACCCREGTTRDRLVRQMHTLPDLSTNCSGLRPQELQSCWVASESDPES
eukprot:359517-Chlamydomonas_euryale.AAC.11